MNDRDWRSWWNTTPTSLAETEFLRQVGRTENGQPTDERDVHASVTAAVDALKLTSDHTALDLCCGNGLITQSVAPYCNKLFGIDYSSSLLKIARQYHNPPNVTYIESSVESITPSMFGHTPIDRVYMCFSTQYFNVKMLARLLHNLKTIATPDFRFFLDDIPDQSRLTAFYNTPDRWQEYELRKANGTEAIGQWWQRDEFIDVATQQGYRCRTIDQEPERRRAHYRFDALIEL